MNAKHTVRGASWGKFKGCEGRFHQSDCGHNYNVPEPFRNRHTVTIKGIHWLLWNLEIPIWYVGSLHREFSCGVRINTYPKKPSKWMARWRETFGDDDGGWQRIRKAPRQREHRVRSFSDPVFMHYELSFRPLTEMVPWNSPLSILFVSPISNSIGGNVSATVA